MSFFSSAKAKLAASKLAEEQLYAQAAEEVASGQIRQGLWAKAIAETGGGEAAAKARYLKLRVDIMRAEAEVTDYAMKQAAKTVQPTEVDLAINFLKGEGYKVKSQGSRFWIHEPLGGKTKEKSAEQVIEYAKERGFRL